MFLIHFSWSIVRKLMIFKGLLLLTLAATNEYIQYTKKMIGFLNKNPSKMYQKPHQKINNFDFMYKSPRAMLVATDSTWNDV